MKETFPKEARVFYPSFFFSPNRKKKEGRSPPHDSGKIIDARPTFSCGQRNRTRSRFNIAEVQIEEEPSIAKAT